MRSDTAAAVSVGVDIGGTKILAGLVDARGAVVDRVRMPTPGTSDERIADEVAAAVRRLGMEDRPVGIAIAGRIDADARRVVQSANLGLVDAPLTDWVEDRLGVECVLVNDADAALRAEHAFGSARGASDVVMISVGTGVGGSSMVGGRLLTGAHGAAGEPGHMIVKLDGRRCGCGGRGCLDQYASGRALGRYARRWHRITATPTPVSPDLNRAAERGETYALSAFDELGLWLGRGIANIVVLLDPAHIVLAGGVVATGDVLVERVRFHLAAELGRRGVSRQPLVSRAALGADSAMIGSALAATEAESAIRGAA